MVYTSYSESLDAIGLSVKNLVIQGGLNVYPNPAKNMIQVKVDEGYTIESVHIYNVLGQKVFTQAVDKLSNTQLDLTHLASGIYNMQVLTNKGLMQAKFEILK